jgi:hypothetical protein
LACYHDRDGVAHKRAQKKEQKMRDFQLRVHEFAMAAFRDDATNKDERNFRFIEEAIELVQACNMKREDVHALVEYVYNRPIGEPKQEVGGTLVGLSALCTAHKINMAKAAEFELDRAWKRIDVIRAKHLTKPRNSPLPGKGVVTETYITTHGAGSGGPGNLQVDDEGTDALRFWSGVPGDG